MRFLSACLMSLLLCACTTMGSVEMRGQFESAPAQEVRYFLDKSYGFSALDMALTPPQGEPTVLSAFPDTSGAFESGPLKVLYSSPPLQPPPPVFWIRFSNERDTLYGVGLANGVVDFGTFDLNAVTMAVTKVDRQTTCWAIHSGEIARPDDRSVVLSFVVAPNVATTRNCAEPEDTEPQK